MHRDDDDLLSGTGRIRCPRSASLSRDRALASPARIRRFSVTCAKICIIIIIFNLMH